MARSSGQSGVPVIDVNGEIIVGFDQRRLEAALMTGPKSTPRSGPESKVSLGAAVADAARILAKRGQIPVFGALVGNVRPGSPAQRGGLQPGDIITELNMRPINNAADIERAIANLSPGSAAQIVIHRGDQVLRIVVTL